MTKAVSAVVLVLFLVVGPAPARGGSGSAVNLQTTDVVEITGSGSRRQVTVSRRVGVGMDAAGKQAFDATLIDDLPSGCKLISPRPGKLHVKALDGKPRDVELAAQKVGKLTRLRISFRSLPSLPAGAACCGCSGGCGRACSIEFSYRSSFPSQSLKQADLDCSVSPEAMPVGRSSVVKLLLSVNGGGIEDSTVAVTVPRTVDGARVSVKWHSPGLRVTPWNGNATRLVSKVGIERAKLVVQFVVKPSRPGAIDLGNLAELAGRLIKPVRPFPKLAGEAGSSEGKAFVRVRGRATVMAG